MPNDLVSKLFLLALVTYMVISANLLTYLGVPYTTEGGLFLFKLHPGSYLLYCAAFLRGAIKSYTQRRPAQELDQEKLIVLYIFTICFCLLYALILTGRSNLAVLLDTFLPAGIAAAIAVDLQYEHRIVLRRTLQACILTNAILSLTESILQVNIIPLYLDSAAYTPPEQEFRPTALFDHPLTGSMITMIGLALTPSCGWSRPLYSLVLAASLISFGGRVVAFVAVLSVTVFRLGLITRSALRRDTRSVQQFTALALISFGALALLPVASAMGFGQRLTGHLYWDTSAQVRLSQWNVIGELTCTELFFGIRREELIALLTPLWLSDGVEVIENFWLLMFVSLGAIGSLFFIAGFTALLVVFWQRTNLNGRILLVSTVAAASTSNSLGHKSPLLVILVAALASLMEPKVSPDRPTARLESGAKITKARGLWYAR